MVGPDFFDAFLEPGGYLPGEENVTLTNPGPAATTAQLVARQEPINEAVRDSLNMAAADTIVVWGFAVGQTGYVRPRLNWKIAQEDGTVWVVVREDVTVQSRYCTVACSKEKS